MLPRVPSRWNGAIRVHVFEWLFIAVARDIINLICASWFPLLLKPAWRRQRLLCRFLWQQQHINEFLRIYCMNLLMLRWCGSSGKQQQQQPADVANTFSCGCDTFTRTQWGNICRTLCHARCGRLCVYICVIGSHVIVIVVVSLLVVSSNAYQSSSAHYARALPALLSA